MSGVTFEDWTGVVQLAAAVVAAGVAIKLMDDWLDRELDALTGRVTLAAALGNGVIAYALAALAIGMLLQPPVAGTLFLAAYALGMAHDATRRLPTGLAAWQELLLAVGAGMLLAGPYVMVASMVAMIFVQCADDLLDWAEDRRRGLRSWAERLGRVETALVAGIALLVGFVLAPVLMGAVIVAAVLVDRTMHWAALRLLPTAGEREGEGSA
ncbi:MAG TPA: hypothetical protein VIK93_03340 [Limnochordales bacterium]